jgi:hypothetical protein
MTNEKECLAGMSRQVSGISGLSAIPMFKTITESELFGDQGGYPLIQEGACFIHEGRRAIPEIHGDGFLEQLYRLDGGFALEFEQA